MSANFDRRTSTQLKSWFKAVDIACEDTTSGLLVTSKEGKKVPVSVISKGEEAVPGVVSIYGPDLTSRNLQKGIDAFDALQRALGYEPRQPVDRGPLPGHKAHYASEFELVAMRHNEFRRSPNPDPKKLADYKLVVDKAIWKFYRKNQQACLDHGLEVGDLRTYATIWTCNYIALHEAADKDQKENERFLFQHLSQRFIEFREQMNKKARNVLPMLDEAFIAMHGRTYEYANMTDWHVSEEEGPADLASFENVVDPEAVVVEEEERTLADQDRSRKSAIAFLNEKLNGMEHDEMVELLANAVGNDRIHVDARRAASRRLQNHAQACAECTGRDLPRAPGDNSVPSNLPVEDELGNVYENPRAAAKALGLYPSNVRAVLSGRYSHTGGHTFKYVAPTSGNL